MPMSEDLRKKGHDPGYEERSLVIQKRLEELEETMKNFGGWSELPEKEKEQWKKTTRVGLELEYEKLGSGSDDEVEDDEELQARKYRDLWTLVWGHLGEFEDETVLDHLRFSENPAPCGAGPCTTIQVFSAKIVGLSGGLRFPLDVYGTIAARDSADRRRNIIFGRLRDDCQTITEQDPYLVLTGPSRAIVLLDPVFIEVMLKVKGTVECEDEILNFHTTELARSDTGHSRIMNEYYISKHSTLHLGLESIASSVEAGISVQVMGAKLPPVFFVTARTSDSYPYSWGSGDDFKKILLFDSRDTSNPFIGDYINLSRWIVSVGIKGSLSVCIEAPDDHSNENRVLYEMIFQAKERGHSSIACPPNGSSAQPGAIGIYVGWSLVWHH